MSALGIAVSVGGVAFVLACVALLRWCDRRSELDARRRAREDLEGYVSDLRRDAHLRGVHIGERLIHPLERQYRDVLRARIDGQIARDFWAGAPPSPWPVDPRAPERAPHLYCLECTPEPVLTSECPIHGGSK